MNKPEIHSLLIEDGHLMNVRIGQRYNDLPPVECDYATPMIDCNWDQPHTWQISIPKWALLRNHLIDQNQLGKLFELLVKFEQQEKPRNLKVYLLLGMYDGPTVEVNGFTLSYFLNALMVLCEQLHQVLPLAEIVWVGPCAWHPHAPYTKTFKMMHAVIPYMATVRPYLKTLDLTLDSNSEDYNTENSLWTLPYLNTQVSKLRKMFSASQEVLTNFFIQKELNLLRIPGQVKIPLPPPFIRPPGEKDDRAAGRLPIPVRPPALPPRIPVLTGARSKNQSTTLPPPPNPWKGRPSYPRKPPSNK
jgi:hypothetical protein